MNVPQYNKELKLKMGLSSHAEIKTSQNVGKKVDGLTNNFIVYFLSINLYDCKINILSRIHT